MDLGGLERRETICKGIIFSIGLDDLQQDLFKHLDISIPAGSILECSLLPSRRNDQGTIDRECAHGQSRGCHARGLGKKCILNLELAILLLIAIITLVRDPRGTTEIGQLDAGFRPC